MQWYSPSTVRDHLHQKVCPSNLACLDSSSLAHKWSLDAKAQLRVSFSLVCGWVFACVSAGEAGICGQGPRG